MANGSLEFILENLRKPQHILVTSHINPDGDAVGATLALGLVLEEMGHSVVLFNPDPIPEIFGFLPAADRWQQRIPENCQFDSTLIIDVFEIDRTGLQNVERSILGKIFILDHHVTDEDHGNGQFIDPTACAAGVLVYRLAQLAGVKISMAMAKNIYACILTDTGSFRYSSTNPEALRVASEFVEMGIEPWFFASQIYENHPPQKLRLLAEVLATLKISEDGLVALIHLDQNTMDRFPDSSELTDGFINFPRSITGVEVAIFLRGNADGSFKASMRSVGNVDVSEICKRYGGGGHRNAAGCSIKEWNKGLDDLIQNLMETAREFCRRQKLS